ncbi:CCA tRNA nucleotidyltransferase [Piscibacillus salipiscarius]|uniref:CCA tRNA nucleotidyltransferase n=1 Tax=Piscibacillus salipiscarius TaxID=299480 RepID=UPI000AB89684|nr:CCA tRNA nucleotidyltransferase [Piscibacillus salipiscarius]
MAGQFATFFANRPIGDIDIATNATPEEVQRIFPRTVPVGIDHGTILVLHNGFSFEITTYRTEGEYDDYRHPSDVSFVKDIKLDLSRRDFTINAIAMDRHGNVLDPFDGKIDLENQIIKTVGSPNERFSEDPLRMLRGVRFVSQLGFQMDSDTEQAIKQLHRLLQRISVERITDEISKLFTHHYINSALNIVSVTNMDRSLPIFDEQEHLFEKLKTIKFHESLNHAGIMFAIFHLLDPNISVQKWIKTYKVSNRIRRKALHLINNYNDYQEKGLTKPVIYSIGKDHLYDFYQLIGLLDLVNLKFNVLLDSYEHLPIKSRDDLVINGQDFINWFPNEKKGKWIGDYLDQIEKLIITEELRNNRDEIESRVREWKARERG